MSSPTKQSDSIVPAANAGATSARPQERRIVGVLNTAKSQPQQLLLLQHNDDHKQKVLTNDGKGAASALLRKGPGGQAVKKEKLPTTQSLRKENSDTIRKSASSKVSVPPSQTGGSVVPTTQPRPSHGSLGRQRIGPIVVGAMVPRPMVIPTGKQTSARHAAPPASAVAPKKKRKLPPPKVSRPNALPLSPSMPLADPFIVKTVHDIIGLLETYGPLTHNQLEYNLPQPSPGAGSASWTKSALTDILQLLVATDVVQIVDEAPHTRYCILGGVPRTDVVLPSQVVGEIELAHAQWKSSQERCEILRKALMDRNVSARELLKSLLIRYPEISQDPVYMAALRNVHVDVAAAERERGKKESD